MNRLYSFTDLLEKGIETDNNKFTRAARILVPKIQRSYAQGRQEEEQVRNSILTDIFKALDEDKDCIFSFVYGSIAGNDKDFELLDGQQRLTTLFLLHAYLGIREGKTELRDSLKGRFSYETRDTSNDFINKLLELDRISEADRTPKQIISRCIWYSNAFRTDSTVQAMLVMLDAIDRRYKLGDYSNLSERLGRLRFYVLPLEKFGLSEDLYIKMNARGLPLTPFENFKADLVGRYKPATDAGSGATPEQLAEVAAWMSFATALDTRWIDIFWSNTDKTDKEFNDKFFRFFYRLCAVLVYTEIHSDGFGKGFKVDDDPLFKFFEETSEGQSDTDGRYIGFGGYSELIGSVDLKERASKILDTFCKHKTEIFESLVYAWNGEKIDVFGPKDTYTRPTAVVFAALIAYIQSHDAFDAENFARWMRMVRNIVENTNIDGIVPQVALARNLGKIVAADACDDIFATLAAYPMTGMPAAIREEQRKAILIKKDARFEEIFAGLENHNFFRGFIDVVLDDSATPEIVEKRIGRISPLFDKDGMTGDNHLLIRAMMSTIRSWNEMRNLAITEKNDGDAHIKALLRRRNDIVPMLQRVLDSDAPLDTLLQAEIDGSKDAVLDSGDISDEQMAGLFSRLTTDIRLWDWIGQSTTASKAMVIKEWDKYPLVHLPRTWYTYIYLGNERRKYIPGLVASGFSYEDPNEQNMYDSYGDYFGNEVVLLHTDGQGRTIQFRFDRGDMLTVRYTELTDSELSGFAERWPDGVADYDSHSFTMPPVKACPSDVALMVGRFTGAV